MISDRIAAPTGPSAQRAPPGWGAVPRAARPTRHDDGAHRADDPDVTGAAAEIARKPEADAPLVRVGQADHQIARRDQHARRAVPALQCVLAREGRAQFGRDLILVETLDGFDAASRARDRECQAGTGRLAVQQNRAGAAYAMLAAKVRAGQAEPLAQEIGKAG